MQPFFSRIKWYICNQSTITSQHPYSDQTSLQNTKEMIFLKSVKSIEKKKSPERGTERKI